MMDSEHHGPQYAPMFKFLFEVFPSVFCFQNAVYTSTFDDLAFLWLGAMSPHFVSS
jgi:hypothetical protein